MQKKLINVKVDSFNYMESEISFEKLYHILKEIKEKLELDGYINITLKPEYYGYDGACDFYIYADRLETDDELNKRIETYKKVLEKEAKKLERKKERYLKLKEEFEK